MCRERETEKMKSEKNTSITHLMIFFLIQFLMLRPTIRLFFYSFFILDLLDSEFLDKLNIHQISSVFNPLPSSSTQKFLSLSLFLNSILSCIGCLLFSIVFQFLLIFFMDKSVIISMWLFYVTLCTISRYAYRQRNNGKTKTQKL